NGKRHSIEQVGELLPRRKRGLSFQRNAALMRRVTPFTTEDWHRLRVRRIALDQRPQSLVITSSRFRRLARVAIGMHAYGVEIFQHAGLEERLQEVPREPG